MLDLDDVVRLARMARFDVDEASAARFRDELNSVLEQLAVLHELHELQGPASPQIDEQVTVRLRDDTVSPDPLQVHLADFAAAIQDGFFTVPRMIGGPEPAH